MKFSESFGRRLMGRRSRLSRDALEVGLLLPTSGPMGLLGPSAYACAQLACKMWNDAGGAGGRQIRLTVLDAGTAAPGEQVRDLLAEQRLDALVGLCNTDVCEQVSRVVAGRIPMMFTPQFEGRGLPGWVHAIGETPEHQLLPALDWMARRYRTRRWYLLGNDYCWPRRSHAAAIGHLQSRGDEIVAEQYVPLGQQDYGDVIERIADSQADAVLVSLIGSDAIHMGRAFGHAGLSRRVLRLSTCVEENAVLGMGADNTAGLFVSAGYFATIDSDANGAFKERYHAHCGERAPALNSLGQSVYEGFVHLCRQSQNAGAARAAPPLSSIRSANRGFAMAGCGPAVHLAEADGLAMRVIHSFSGARG